MVLENRFDSVRVDAALIIWKLLEFLKISGNRRGEMNMISRILYNSIMTILHRRDDQNITSYQAKGIAVIFNYVHDFNKFVVRDVKRLTELFGAIFAQLKRHSGASETEITDSLTGVVRDLWNDRDRPCGEEGDADFSASQILMETISHSHHWKTQVVGITMAYFVWRCNTGMRTGTSELVNLLSTLLARGDVTPLSTSEGLLVVHWLSMLLISDRETARSALTTETAVRIARIFAKTKRFGNRRGSSDNDTLIDEIVRQIVNSEFKDHASVLFSATRIPKLTNRAIVESHVAFWFLLGSSQCTNVTPELLSMLAGATKDDDDMHCMLLEFFASGQVEYEWTTNFLRSEITRGDASLLPTIATAIRIASFDLKSTSFVAAETISANLEFVRENVKFLISNLHVDQYRFLLVLNNAYLLDLGTVGVLWESGDLNELLDLGKFAASNDAIRDIHSAILGRVCFVTATERNSNQIVDLLIREINRLLSMEDSEQVKQIIKDMVSVIKILERFIKYSRFVPRWSLPAISLAVRLLRNVKDEIRDVGSSFLALVARFVDIVDVADITVHKEINPKEGETVVGLKSNILMNRAGISGGLSALNSFEFAVPFSQVIHPAVIAAYKSSLADLLVPQSLHDLNAFLVDIRDYSNLEMVRLCALVTLSSLHFDLPEFGIKAVTKLANALDSNLEINTRKLCGNTLSEFLKTLTDRGSRERTEAKFDSHTRSMIRSGKGKHSYIS